MTDIDWFQYVLEAAESAVETLCWSETEYEGGRPVGCYSESELSPQCRLEVLRSMSDVVSSDVVQKIIRRRNIDAETFGHNFYLSANGHGTGFWDLGWGDDGKCLDELSQLYSCALDRHDDGMVYAV